MKKKSIRFSLNQLVILPMLCLGIIWLIVSIPVIYSGIEAETEEGLKNLSHSLLERCNVIDDGDYSLENGTLCKGETAFGADFTIVDSVKEVSGIDATIFWGDTRMLTTVALENGQRAVGTKATEQVTEQVIGEGKEYFSTYAWVNGTYYYGYYVPMKNSDGTVIGMTFVGKSRQRVIHTIFQVVLRMMCVGGIIMVITLVVALRYARGIVNSLSKTRIFLAEVSQGNLECQMDGEFLTRKDEIGELGRFAIMMQESILKLVGTDPLTGLYNRRSCNEVLEKAVHECQEREKKFAVVIGDIDNFKKLNDTYGHLAGDQVLKSFAGILKMHMKKRGSAFRWGGEEFLLVYKEENPIEGVEALLEELRMTQIFYKEQVIQATMTFGVSICRGDDTTETLVKRADDRLYYGKENGKNQVVYGTEN